MVYCILECYTQVTHKGEDKLPGRYKKGWSKEHQAVFKAYVEGLTTAEIVAKTGFGVDKVRNIIRTNKFQEYHEKIVTNSVESARKLFESRLVEAAGQVIRLMKLGKPDERLKFDAAKEILYQCGLKPVEVVETRTRECRPEELKSALGVVKEIQTIEEKLSTQGSEFLVKKETDEPSSPAVPVETDGAKTLEVTEEVAVV